MRPYIYNLTANDPVKVSVKGNFYRITEGTAPVKVREDHSAVNAILKRGQGIKSDKAEFNMITLTSEVDQTVEIFIGFGQMFDDRVSGAIDAAGLVSVVNLGGSSYSENFGLYAAAGVALKILPENIDRVSATVYADIDFTYSGTEASAQNGIPYSAGGLLTIENTAELWIYPAADGPIKVLRSIK